MEVHVADATQRSERLATTRMLKKVRRRHGLTPSTLAADKGYDTEYAYAAAAAFNFLCLARLRAVPT